MYDNMVARFGGLYTTVSCGPLDERDISLVFEAVLNDHPELFYIVPSGNITVSSTWGKTLQTDLLYPQTEIVEMQQRVQRLISDMRNSLCGADEETIEKAVCDFFVANCVYEIDNRYNQNAVAALLKGKAQCSGFSRAAKWLLEELGVKCHLITGYSDKPHAWNIIQIGGVCHHLDVTAIIACNTAKTKPYFYPYFNFGDETCAIDHRWNRAIMPPCPRDYTGKGIPLVMPSIDSIDDLRNALGGISYTGNVDIMLRCNFITNLQKAMNTTIECLRQIVTQKRLTKRITGFSTNSWLCLRIFDPVPSEHTASLRPAARASTPFRPSQTSTSPFARSDSEPTTSNPTARPTTPPRSEMSERPTSPPVTETSSNIKRLDPVSTLGALRTALMGVDYTAPCTVLVQCNVYAGDESKLIAAITDVAGQVLRQKNVRRHIDVTKNGNMITICFAR